MITYTRYICDPIYYHHHIGSVHLCDCWHMFPWLCVWGGCTIIFCHLLHIYPGNTGTSLQWRHNDHDCVSNHQPRCCLLNRLFRRRSKKTSKLHVTGLCVGNSSGPVNSPHKGPATRKMFPFDDVIMCSRYLCAVFGVSKWSDTFRPVGRVRLFANYTISLSSLYKLIWSHWTT